ncbi:MAG: ABC transporter substrate-binding protein [Pseudomonadota bacterium]
MLRRNWLRGAGLAALALAVGAFGSQVLAQGKLKVGIVAFYTGAAAGPFGIPSRNAAELVIEAINKGEVPAPYNSKGVAGLEIEPVYVDEAGGTTKQVTEYRNMIQRQGINAVVGYISSGSCLAVAPVAEELKTFTILFDCGTPRIYEDGKYSYVFRTSATATMDSVGAARYIATKFPDTASAQGINQNYAWGQDSWRDFELAMKQLLPAVSVKEPLWPKLFQGQYGAEISRLSVTPPQILHSSLWGGDLESFILQSAARSLHKRTKMVMTTAETVMFRLGRRLPDGVIIGARGPYGVLARDTELNRWFRAKYQDRFNTPPTYPAYQMAQALIGLKLAYDAAAKDAGGKKPTSEQAAAGLRGKTFEAFGTTVEMKLGNGQQAITETAYGISKWDSKTGQQTISEIVYYPATCVNPPDGVKSVDWIRGGMKGASC